MIVVIDSPRWGSMVAGFTKLTVIVSLFVSASCLNVVPVGSNARISCNRARSSSAASSASVLPMCS